MAATDLIMTLNTFLGLLVFVFGVIIHVTSGFTPKIRSSQWTASRKAAHTHTHTVAHRTSKPLSAAEWDVTVKDKDTGEETSVKVKEGVTILNGLLGKDIHATVHATIFYTLYDSM